MTEIAILSAEEMAAHTMLHESVIPLARQKASVSEDVSVEGLYIEAFEVVLAVINEIVAKKDVKMAQQLRNNVLDAIDISNNIDNKENTCKLAHRLGAALMIYGRYDDAEKALLQSMAGMTKLHGELSTQVVQVCATLSTLHEQRGEYRKAVGILARVLKAQENSFGENSRVTLNTVASLAGLLSHVGDLQQSHDMYERATSGLISLARAENGGQEGSEDKDFDVLCCLGNQALLMEKRGDRQGALQLCKRALRGKIDLLTEQHPEALRSFNNLACMLEADGQNDEAYEMFQKCLAGRTATLGPTHPETLSSESACANLLLKQGKAADAVKMYENVVAAFATAVGASSPLFIKALQELGFARMQNEDLENALSCYKQVTQLKLKAYGAGHPGTLKSFFDTGLLLMQMDDTQAAKKMLKAAKEGYEAVGNGYESLLQRTNMLIAMLENTNTEEGK